MLAMEWSKLFAIEVPLLELVVRGSAMYLFLFITLRIVVRRQLGTTGASDLLMLVLIADAAQNAMSSHYNSVLEGCVLCATIIFWNYFIDWLEFMFPSLGRLIEPPPMPLIVDGVIQWKNLRRELITLDELNSQLREQGIADVSEVKRAFQEGDGHISVIKAEDDNNTRANPKDRHTGAS
jgi:uncharacterized membrane protein YcaP (DUF421 family)